MVLLHRNKIGRGSIKESLDNLPGGICFMDQNGLIVLCNKQMYRLCHILLGRDLQHISEFYNALKKPQRGVRIVNGDTKVYWFPSGLVWKFVQSEISDLEGNIYTQVQAVDVTSLYQKEYELEQENRRLEEMNARARNLYTELDKIVCEEENFAVKTHVHNEMGELLGVTYNLMMQREIPIVKLRSVTKRWERIITTLGTAADDEEEAFDSDKSLAQLTEIIAGIGIVLYVKGEFPKNRTAANLLVAAVRECAINTVRHAKGSKVEVVLEKTEGSITASITNNGIVPEGKVIEGGGLSALRQRIESVGGAMYIESSPAFKLMVTLYEKEKAV